MKTELAVNDLAVASTAADLDVLSLVRTTIIVSDRNGTILRAHGGSGLPLGYRPSQLEGRNAIEFIAPEDHQVMTGFYLGVENMPILANPEPFPLRVVGPDGIARFWECVARGFVADDVDGWIIAATCRREQNPAMAAMDSLVAGGSPQDIAVAVARRHQENSTEGWNKTALVLHRCERVDGEAPRWEVLQPPAGTDAALVDALHACLDDPSATWNHLVPGAVVTEHQLPQALASAATAAGLPHCTMLAAGIDDETRIVFVRLTNFEYELRGNNTLTDQAIHRVLRKAFEDRRSRSKLDAAMHTDPLTGIANRRHFEQVLINTPNAAGHAALFVDVDEFKTVNDTFGHSVGDAALCEVATRIAVSCRPHDLVARIGGDEFGIVLRNVTPEEAQAVAGRIHGAMQLPFDLAEGPTMISVTVGIASPTSAMTLRELVHRADLAMLADKNGRAPGTSQATEPA